MLSYFYLPLQNSKINKGINWKYSDLSFSSLSGCLSGNQGKRENQQFARYRGYIEKGRYCLFWVRTLQSSVPSARSASV